MDNEDIGQVLEKLSDLLGSKPSSNLAVFWDVENVTPSSESLFLDAFMEFLQSHGRPVLLQAFADWGNQTFKKLSEKLSENSFQLIHTPNARRGKNSSDISLIAFGIETALKFPWVETFVIVSGDSDFRPFVQSLRRSGKKVVIVCDTKVSDSTLLAMADEFQDYKQLVADYTNVYEDDKEESEQNIETAYQTLKDAVASLNAENKLATYSETKVRMLILDPQFNEKAFKFKKFSEFVRSAEKNGYVKLVSEQGQIQIHLAKNYTEPKYKSVLLKAINEAEPKKGEWVDASIVGTKIRPKDYGFSQLKKLLLHAENLNYIETKAENMALYVRIPQK